MPEPRSAVVAVYANHGAAEAAIRKVAEAGLDMCQFSILGRGDPVGTPAAGLRGAAGRIRFWAGCGALWGGLGGLLLGGLLVTVPEVGLVLVVGHMAMVVVTAISAAVDGAVVMGGLGALGAALAGLGLPEQGRRLCQEALKADRFLVVGHGTGADIAWARALLQHAGPVQIAVHAGEAAAA